jgi:hypothetical protein
MTPVLESERPGGSSPLATVVEKVYGAWPPLAVSVWLYAVPTVPEVRVVGVTVIVGALTVMEAVAAADVPLALVAVYVKLSEPKKPVVGV